MAAGNEILGDNNDFYWELNARMKLAQKNILLFIDVPVVIKDDVTAVAEWKAKDLKAFAILSAMINAQYQTTIRNATSTAQLCMKMEYTTTKLQLANFLTKSIAARHFEQLIKLSGIRNVMLRGSAGDQRHNRKGIESS
uniref:AlNc14C110G6343 protein n=1 Tax=Albugo laibachii Nc14 TaxID=890382 RepID=F0WIE2_9STRA|nr:AlNc14C110G6343 [Albugo laibachii Nc14]|eukprot:CCA21023.1 AlNc14C110G6343 [Albugo laibachii Nc14]